MNAERELRRFTSNDEARLGKIWLPVVDCVKTAPDKSYPDGFVCIKSYALPNESRVFEIKRTFPPN